MSDARTYPVLRPLNGLPLSPEPWSTADDGTIYDAAGRCVCVIGSPFDNFTEQDLTNASAIVHVPRLLAILRGLLAIRPANWKDDDDPEQVAAWTNAAAILAVLNMDPELWA